MKRKKINYNNLADKTYWENSYKNIELSIVAADDPIRIFLEKYVPKANTSKTNRRCFEIGCFPGRYLAVLGKLGYKLNGLDLNPSVEKAFPKWLKSQGYQIGKFEKVDFLNYRPIQKYDLVCSFGFLEHFPNWRPVLNKHAQMVKPGGYLLIATPNFRGLLQRIIHYYLDRENYRRHCLPVMNPKIWASLLKVKGFGIIQTYYLGKFDYWVEEQHRTEKQLDVLEKLKLHLPTLQKILPPNNQFWSPYCMLIAQKKNK